MMSYKNILVTTDLTPSSRAVIAEAKQLAVQSNATLHVIHVIEYSAFAYAGEFSTVIDPNLEQTIEAGAREVLGNICNELDIGVEHQYVLHGSVKASVHELADKLKADLIVVGSHSHHGVEILLGSKANAILHSAKCDVLTIRISE